MYDTETLERIHKTSSKHRATVLQSRSAGCFYCLRDFKPSAVNEWWDDNAQGVGQTAVCPHCGIDAVIADASGWEITCELLVALNEHYF